MSQGFCVVEMIFDENAAPVDYRFLEINPVVESQTGLKNALGKTARELVPSLEEHWFRIYGNVALTGKPEQFIEGSEVMGRWFEVNAFRLNSDDNRKVAILFTDITGRKKAEQSLQESENYLRQLTDTVPAIVWITDPVGYCTYLNHHWYQYTGQTKEEAEGFGWLSATHPDDKDEAEKKFLAANAAQKPFSLTYRLRTQNGEYRWAKDSGSPKFSKDGLFEGFIGTVIDVHEEKLAEEKLRESEERQTYLLQLSDAIKQLADPHRIQYEAACVLGRYLGAARVGYAEDSGDGIHVTVTRNFTQNVPGIEGTYKYNDYGPELLKAFLKGQTVVRADIAADPSLTDAEKEAHASLHLGATVNVPLLKGERLVAVLFVHWTGPRPLLPKEIGLVEETAERTWAVVERAKAQSSLQLSEERYRTLFNSIDEGFCTLDVLFDENGKPYDYRFLEINDAFEKQTGFTNAVGKTMNEFATLEDFWYETYAKVALTGKAIRFESRAENLNSHYDVYAFKVGGADERKVAVLFADITQRKKTEEALRESEARFRLMTDSIPEMIWVTDANGYAEYINKRLEIYSGIPFTQETAAEIAARFIHPDDAPTVMEAFAKSLATGQPMEVEQRNRSVSGEYRWFLNRAIPYRDPKTGEIVKWFGISTEIHDRKMAEQQLKESESRFQNLVRDAAVGIILLTGKEMKVEVVNEAYGWLIGRTSDELLGKELFSLIPEAEAVYRPILTKVLETGEDLHLYDAAYSVRKGAQTIEGFINISYQPYRDGSGNVTGVLALIQDTTPSVKAKKALEETERRQTYLLQLSDALRPLANANAIKATAARILGEHLGADRALYCEYVEKDGEGHLLVEDLYHVPQHPFPAGLYAFKTYGRDTYELAKGNTVVVPDVSAEEGIAPEAKQALLQIGCIAYVALPLMKDGKLVAMLGLHQATPRQWTEEDLLLLRETAQRTWLAVEKVKTEKALAESESRYRRLIQANIVGILFWDLDGGIVDANDELLRMLGYTKEDLHKGLDWRQITPEMWQEADAEGERQVVETGQHKPFEKQYLHKDGHPVDVIIASSAFEGTGNRRGVTFVVDISERKKAEAALQKSETLFRNILEQSPDPVLILTGEDMVLRVANEPLFRLWKVDSTAIGKPFLEILPEMKGQGFFEMLQDVYFNDKVIRGSETPAVFERADGTTETIYFNFVYQPYRENDGAITGVMVLATDVTAQVVANDRLRQSEELFRSFSNNIQNLAWIADGEGWIYWYNQRWYEYTGTTLEEMQGWGWEKVHHPDHIDRVVDFVKEAWKKPEPFELTFPLRGADGVYRWFLTRAVPVINADGKIERWIGTNTNINEQKLAEEATRESESRFRSLANDTPAFLFTADAETNLDFVNRQWLEFVGLQEEEGFGKAWERVTHPEDVGPMYAIYSEAVKNKTSYRFEIRQKNTDGEYRWVLWNGKPRLDAQGNLVGIAGIGIDITDQKQVQQIIQVSEERFRQMADLVPQILWTARPDGFIDYYNRRWYEYTGFREGFGDASWTPVVHPDDLQGLLDIYYQSIANGTAYQHEFRMKEDTTGQYRWFIGQAVPVRNEEGRIFKWFGSCTDIHAQKLIAETLRESESRFRTLAETLPQLVWMTDAEGNQEYVSKRWIDYTGIMPAGAETWGQILHPDDLQNVGAVWAGSLATGNPYSIELRLKGKDGTYHWFYGTAEAIKGAAGNIIKWVGSFTDIHEQRTFTDKLEKEVAERTKELQRSNEDLQQFAHVASHDLKEPVRKVKTFASRLEQHLDGKLDETASRFMERIHSAANRMFSMIDGVLTYSTLNASIQAPQPVDVNEVMKNIETDLEVTVQNTGAQFRYSSLPTIEGAPVLLYQLFYNLVNNSIKFAKAGVAPQISIIAERVMEHNRPFVKFVLTDNGIGFEQEQSQRIFETFMRLNSKDKYEGTGLGLALCKKIVERHGGSITASGTLGQGAAFTILLPVEQKTTGI